jgi:DNA-binding beta-propeller fold protein YncE
LTALVGTGVWIIGFGASLSPAGPPALPLAAVLEANGCVPAAGWMVGDRASYASYQSNPLQTSPPAAWPDWKGHEIAGGDVPPVRTVSDPYPNFHGLAIDVENDRVVMSDSNRHGLLVYDRAAATASQDAVATPLSWVRGPATGMMFVSGVAIDPARKEMHTVDNDIGDRLVTFSYDATGNVAPKRMLIVPHQAWGLALDVKRNEIAVTVESSNMIAIFDRDAEGEAKARRIIRGVSTRMADPHGIAFDPVNDEYVVVNHGNRSAGAIGGVGGRADAVVARPAFEEPSIMVFAAAAGGDVAPVRVIQGNGTGLNWPMGVAVSGDEIAVGNHADNSVLVFSRTAQGNAAPIRRIKGGRTGLDEPISVAFDAKRNELWVTNYNDHSALVFDARANGDVAPLRTLRNGPRGAPVVGFGNAGAVAYDSKRQEILVPN